jgi:predicted SprT family Zn-dependent metalloprotease
VKLQDAEHLARELLDLHGLADWPVEFNRSRKEFGACRRYPPTIILSRYFTELNDEAEVRDTILHEIAHAKLPPRQGHDALWKEMARSVGAKPERCCGEGVVAPRLPFIGRCPVCGYTVEGYQRYEESCGKCADAFDPDLLLVWERAAA